MLKGSPRELKTTPDKTSPIPTEEVRSCPLLVYLIRSRWESCMASTGAGMAEDYVVLLKAPHLRLAAHGLKRRAHEYVYLGIG